MAKLGFNQTPIEPFHSTSDPILYPATDKNPARTQSRRAIGQALAATVWRIGDFLQDGFPAAVTTTLQNLEQGAIGALSQYLIDRGHKALFVFGSQALPNNAAYRSATGGDSAWTQVNFADHNMYRMPVSAWAVRWAYQQAVLDFFKDYFSRMGKNWADYIELELTNEPSKITTPAATETTASGSHTVSASELAVASTSGFAANDWVTIQGAGAWQSFKVGGTTGGKLQISAGTCSSDYGNTKSDTLAVAVANGAKVVKCQYRASDSDYFGALDSGTYDEMDYESANVKGSYPEVFLWGPSLAAGDPTSIAALFGSGRSFIGLCDGFNYHAYSKNPGYYIGDEARHSTPIPDDIGEAGFARSVIALHFSAYRTFRTYTTKPIMCSEWGLAGATAQLGATGHRSYTAQKFSYLLAAALDAVASLPIRYAVLWGPDRQGLGDDDNSLDMITQAVDKDTSATFLIQSAKAMTRSGTAPGTVPAGFTNTGAATGVA